MCPTFPPLLPLPLVSLRFGSSSVLDTLVLDVDDSHSTLRPLFSIETADDDTSVYRLDHDAHPDPTARLSAAIKWSSTSSKTLVSINGSTHFSSTFLKKTVLGGSRKFHVPGQSNALKWKHVGSHYECTLCSHACTMHRAVATLEPGHTTALPRLSIYTSSVLPHTSHQSESYKGVDVSLLEYLIVTTILLLRKDHSGHNTPSTTGKNNSQFLAPTTPTTISSSSSGSYSPLFSTSPAVACQRSTSTRSTRSGGQRTPGTRPVLDLLEDEDVPSPTTPYSPNKPQSPMLKPVTNSPRMRASPLLKPLSACPSPFSSASSSSSVAGGSVSSLPASPVTPFSHIGVHSPLNQDTFATANYQVLNGSHRDPRAESVEEPTVPFQIPLPASHEHRTLSHSASYGQLRSPTSASSSSTATFTQSPLTYIPFTSPSTHYAAPTPASPSTHVSTQNVASQRTYAPTPTRPPASSTNDTASAGHAMGRSHSHGAIPRKIANKLPSPILSSLAFFHHHSHSQSTKSTSTSGHGKSNSRARTNDDEREREPEPGPGAITPYQLPPTPSHPPPPPPSAPASMTTYATHVQAYSASMSSGSGSTLSRDPTITPYTLPPFSPRTQATNSVPPQGENALLLETDTNTSSLSGSSNGPDRSGPSPLQYTTEMYHIMFETGQYASSSASATMPQQRRESLSSSQHRRESSTTMTQHNQQHTRRESMPAQPRRDSASASGASRPTRIFQEVPAPSASDLEALGIADFFGTGSRSHSSPRAAQPHPLLQSSPRPAQPHLTLLNTNNGPSSPRLETHSRSPITRTVPIDDFEQLGVDDRAIDLEAEERGNGNGEALPSYNEIEWTVRVRQPRVRERQANAHAHNERTFAAHGQDGVLGLALVH